jgi:hypothetical protein
MNQAMLCRPVMVTLSRIELPTNPLAKTQTRPHLLVGLTSTSVEKAAAFFLGYRRHLGRIVVDYVPDEG